MKSITRFILLIATAIMLHSCSKAEYTDAIPNNSTALIAVNAIHFASDKSPFASLLTPFMEKDTKQLKGIDLTKDIYLFAAADGNLGLCAPVADNSSLEDFTTRLETIGVLNNHKEIDGNNFYTFKDQWVMGNSDNCLLIMGPVTGADAQNTLMRRMTRLLDRDDDETIKDSPLWDNLSELNGKIRMVAQASALPEQLALIVTLGAPKGTDASDILLKADMEYDKGTLVLNGKATSYNQNVEQSMAKSLTTYRPITIDWRKVMNNSTLVGIFMNVKGSDIMPLIQQNKSLNSMLMGTESYDRIRSNNGNMAIMLSPDRKGSSDNKYNVSVNTSMPDTGKGNDRMIVAVNIKSLTEPIAESIKPFLGNINTIIYNLKVE